MINCAAYTNVAEAEKNFDTANLVNNIAADNLAKFCSKLNIQLVHISTDFVFDGKKIKSYNENDIPNPIGNYGKSKLYGERNILNYKLENSVIIRTSWLYSMFGDNFVKKIIKSAETNSKVFVVENEFGSPTCAHNLAQAILKIIPKIKSNNTIVYNYSDNGSCSRYEFALEIKKIFQFCSEIVPRLNQPEKSIRPTNSALNITKFERDFNMKTLNWKKSLNDYLLNFK